MVWRECIFGIFLLAMAWVDWRKRTIPNGLLLAGIINWAAWTYLLGRFDKETLCAVMVSAVIPSCILILVLFLEKRKGCLMMGGGDVKLMFVMALYFDWYRLLQVVFTTCVAALLFVVVSVWKGKGGKSGWERKDAGAEGMENDVDGIPLGPCFVIGFVWGIFQNEPLRRLFWKFLWEIQFSKGIV